MQGYRTIIVNAVMMLTGEGTVQFSDLPPDAQHWLSMLIVAWGVLMIFMRLVTKTPIGMKLAAKVEQDLGLTPAQAAAIAIEANRQADRMVAVLPAQDRATLTAAQDVAQVAVRLTSGVLGGAAAPGLVAPQQNAAAPPPAATAAAQG